MKRKGLKALMIMTIVVMLVLIFAMVGCKPKKPVDDGKKTEAYDISKALGEVVEAADNTLGAIKSSTGDIGIGLSLGVKVENFKMQNSGLGIDVKDVNFDGKVKIGANLSKNKDNIEGLAEVTVGGAEKPQFGIYTQKSIVYIRDGVTKAQEQKIKVSGAQAIDFNKYITSLPDTLILAIKGDGSDDHKGLDLGGLVGGLIEDYGDILGSLIDATKNSDGSINLRVILIEEGEKAGLGSLMSVIKDILKNVPAELNNTINTYLPLILGGTFDDFSAGNVKKACKITLNVGIKDKELTGLTIGLDLSDLSEKGMGGKIEIKIGDLTVKSGKAEIGMPTDLETAGEWKEGALTAELALDVPNNPALCLSAKLEFSPNLDDSQMKVSVIAKKKDGAELAKPLQATYTKVREENGKDIYAIVFDMAYLYEAAGLPVPEGGSIYKYELNIGEFLLNLIQKQRSFVFFDETEGGFYKGAKYAEFFKAPGAAFTKEDLLAITPKVQKYYADKFGGVAADYEVQYRNPDGTLAMNVDGSEFTPYTQVGKLGFNFELTAVVNLKADHSGASTYDRKYVEMTFKNAPGGGDKTVWVRTGESVDFAPFAPQYTVADGKYFAHWLVGTEQYKDLTAVNVTDSAAVQFVTEDIGQNAVVNFKQYDLATGEFVNFKTEYYKKITVGNTGKIGKDTWELKPNTTGFDIETKTLPDVPVIPGMKGSWLVVSAEGWHWRDTYYAVQVMSNGIKKYSADTDGPVNVYPFYEIDTTYDWSTADSETLKLLEARFAKTKPDGYTGLTSIIEQGDPSEVGKGALGAVIGNLKELVGILKDQSVDLDFVAKVAGGISPYLNGKELLAARVRDILSPLDKALVNENLVSFPYVMPELLKSDGKTAIDNAKDLFALKSGSTLTNISGFAGVIEYKDAGDNWSSQNSNDAGTRSSSFQDRCYYAMVYATRQWFIEKFGSLSNEQMAALEWDADQQSNYTAKTTNEERATVYVTNEKATYSKKVAAAELKIKDAVDGAEEKALQAIGGYLGAGAVSGCNTVCDFLFGTNKNDPLQISLAFKTPEGNDGFNVTVTVKRKSGAKIAEISGEVFFSLASGIIPPTFTQEQLDSAIDVVTKIPDPNDAEKKVVKIVYELGEIAKAFSQGGNSQEESGNEAA